MFALKRKMALHSRKITEHSHSQANSDFYYSKPSSTLHNKSKFFSNMKQTAASKPKISKYKWKILASNPKKAVLHIHSLTKLYESIPDYMELSHLSGKDFYSTLASLRYNYYKLKDKELRFCKPRLVSENLSRSPEASISSCLMTANHYNHNFKNSDTEKICQSMRRSNAGNNEGCNHSCEFGRNIKTKELRQRPNLNAKKQIDTISSGVKNLAINDEVTSEKVPKFPRKLDIQNDKFQYPFLSDKITESVSLKQPKPVNVTKRSLSCNSLNVMQKSKVNTSHNVVDKKSNIVKSSLKDANISGSHSRIRILPNSSAYDQSKSKEERDNSSVPEITANVTNASDNTETDTASSIKNNGNFENLQMKSKNHQKQKSVNAPFKIFNIDCHEKCSNADRGISAAVHPAARPNLAATLRFDYCKSKFAALKDLKHCNSVSTGKCNKFDWEVRKSPAWKSLLFDESHKDILAIRLAARKAELALQHREHQLNMELMRERVKSSPLLLEGATFWTSSVNQNIHQADKYIQARNSKTLIPKCNGNNNNSIDTNKRPKSLNFTNQHLPTKSKQPHYYSSLKNKAKNSVEITKSEGDSDPRIDNESADDLCSLDRALL